MAHTTLAGTQTADASAHIGTTPESAFLSRRSATKMAADAAHNGALTAMRAWLRKRAAKSKHTDNKNVCQHHGWRFEAEAGKLAITH